MPPPPVKNSELGVTVHRSKLVVLMPPDKVSSHNAAHASQEAKPAQDASEGVNFRLCDISGRMAVRACIGLRCGLSTLTVAR